MRHISHIRLRECIYQRRTVKCVPLEYPLWWQTGAGGDKNGTGGNLWRWFFNTSHGFRPERSCHTALLAIKREYTGTKWFIEGDIKGFFDNINHEVLINILKEKIDDGRFIRLIRKFLRAGYLENWKFHRTYSGTPQGGIISPILANIYLDKFDKYMQRMCDDSVKEAERDGCSRKPTNYIVKSVCC